MLLSGACGKVIYEKTWSKKSCDTVPLSSRKYGFGIRDQRSETRKNPIPDPGSRGRKGTGPATLESFTAYCLVEETHWPELLQKSVRLQSLQQNS